MICAIHQPQYLPWLGYLDKIDRADVFVFLDDVQFKKNEWQNRNRIRTRDGWQWLTVPVRHDFGQEIRSVQIDADPAWRRKHWQSLQTHYGRAGHFALESAPFRQMYEQEWSGLCELNLESVRLLCRAVGIETPMRLASELGVPGAATEKLIGLCRAVGADSYLSGVGGRDYLDEAAFGRAGVRLVYQAFEHPAYPQVWEGFVSHLSAVDLLFNCGGESLDVLRSGRARGPGVEKGETE